MIFDKFFCMNSFLMYRYIYDPHKTFKEGIVPTFYEPQAPYYYVENMNDVEEAIDDYLIDLFSKKNKVALMLSGGIDSQILAKKVPKDTKCFTFRSIADGAIDESKIAEQYANENGLEHEIIDIHWSDFELLAPKVMEAKGAPVHSIAIQIYKAALIAKEQGYDCLLFGESADIKFGGFGGLLSKDWTLAEFINRYSFVNPIEVLKVGETLDEPYREFMNENGTVDVYGFMNYYFYRESVDCYITSCETAGVKFASPFYKMKPKFELDIDRIRRGENKYILRELFTKLYPNKTVAPKIPMPRAVDIWLKDWKGPIRSEFREDLVLDNYSGDQKWMIYCLEQFLNIMEINND